MAGLVAVGLGCGGGDGFGVEESGGVNEVAHGWICMAMSKRAQLYRGRGSEIWACFVVAQLSCPLLQRGPFLLDENSIHYLLLFTTHLSRLKHIFDGSDLKSTFTGKICF